MTKIIYFIYFILSIGLSEQYSFFRLCGKLGKEVN